MEIPQTSEIYFPKLNRANLIIFVFCFFFFRNFKTIGILERLEARSNRLIFECSPIARGDFKFQEKYRGPRRQWFIRA